MLSQTRDERSLTREDICALLLARTPAVSMWAERALGLFRAAPPVPGAWLPHPFPEEYQGWPTVIVANDRIGREGRRERAMAASVVAEHVNRLARHGFDLDLDLERVIAAKRQILGVVVSLPSEQHGAAPYPDPAFPWWTPWAQVWRLEEPVALTRALGNGWFTMLDLGLRRKVVRAMAGATRLI